MKSAFFSVLVGAGVLCMGVNSFAASITFDGSTELFGTGLGHVATVLTIQHNSSEWGSVLRDSETKKGVTTYLDVTDGDAKTGASQSRTWTKGDLADFFDGQTFDRDHFALVFNLDEPGNDSGVDVQGFKLRFYTSETALTYFEAEYTPATIPEHFARLDGGTGQDGYLFSIDMSQAEWDSWTRVGMVVLEGKPILNCAGDGETFNFAAPASFGPVPTVPLPSSVMAGSALMAGLVVLRAIRRSH